MSILTLEQAIKRYGKITDGVWPDEPKWCSALDVPDEIGGRWISTATGFGLSRLYCNNDLHAPLLAVFKNILDRGLVSQLRSYDGCFQIRSVRGESYLSTHAYALAIDINASENEMGTRGNMSHDLVKCFTDQGFAWGGDFNSRIDPMHFSRAWE